MSLRKLNAILTAAIMLLFLFHIITGSLQLAGIVPGGNMVMKIAAEIMGVAVLAHALTGAKLTADTLIAQKKSGAGGYYKENRLFWARRISGFAVLLFMLAHTSIFAGNNKSGAAFRLNLFDVPQLVCSLLLVLTLLLHIGTNIKPLMNAFGVSGRSKELSADIAVIVSVLLLLAGAAFVIYFIRWGG